MAELVVFVQWTWRCTGCNRQYAGGREWVIGQALDHVGHQVDERGHWRKIDGERVLAGVHSNVTTMVLCP